MKQDRYASKKVKEDSVKAQGVSQSPQLQKKQAKIMGSTASGSKKGVHGLIHIGVRTFVIL